MAHHPERVLVAENAAVWSLPPTKLSHIAPNKATTMASPMPLNTAGATRSSVATPR